MINQLNIKFQLSILSVIGAIAVLGVLPFAAIRYLQGSTAVAAVNVALVLGIISLVIYAHRSKKPRAASAIIAVFINGGVVVMAAMNGVNSFFMGLSCFCSYFFSNKAY